MKFRIVNKIACGYFACVYLVRYEDQDENFGNVYAMRVSRYPANKIKEKHNSITNELEFMKFASSHPQFFALLKFKPWFERDYKMVDNPVIHSMPDKPAYNKSPFTLFQIYEYVGDVWINCVRSLNRAARITSLIQIFYAVMLMNNAGYRHRDLNPGNITIRQVEADMTTDMQLGGTTIKCKTYGWMISLIDFGSIAHKNWSWNGAQINTWINDTLNEFPTLLFHLFVRNTGTILTKAELSHLTASTPEIDRLIDRVTDKGKHPLRSMERSRFIVLYKMLMTADEQSLYGFSPTLIMSLLPLVYKPVALIRLLLNEIEPQSA